MRSAQLLLFLVLFKSLVIKGQTDSVMYSPDVRLEDGIYLNYSDFRWNRAVKKQQIISKLDKDQLEFLSKIVFEEKFSYELEGSMITVESRKVWGYIQNNTLYVNFKGEFYRVPVFGSVSYLVATVLVTTPGFYDPRFGIATGTSTVRELREFLMNFYDGQVTEFTLEAAEQLLSRDKTLYGEYTKLGRRRQKEQIYGFIRRYNAQHPVYFLR